MLALRLPEAIESRLDQLAKATGRSKSYYARQAIVEHIDEIEARARAEAISLSGDDPFATFSEWDSAADRRAYGDL